MRGITPLHPIPELPALSERPQAPDNITAAIAPVAASRRSSRVPGGALAPLPTREARRRFRNLEVEAILDLHGCSKIDAYEKLNQFIRRQQHAHRRHVLIITGKGKDGAGILRQALPHWLNEAPLRAHISAYAVATPEKGGTGVTHVLLKQR